MATIMVGNDLTNVFQVLTPEWYLLKDGSPLPANMWEPRLVRGQDHEGAMVSKCLNTILAVYGYLPKKLGWTWRSDQPIGQNDPGYNFFTVGWTRDGSWRAALSFTSRRIILPWDQAKGISPLTELEKMALRRESHHGDAILVRSFMDRLHFTTDAAEAYLVHERAMLIEEDRRCRKAQ